MLSSHRDPALKRGYQVVDLRPPRRTPALTATAELPADPRDLSLERQADMKIRPRREPSEPLAPERPSDKPEVEPVSNSFPSGERWEITREHAARWRSHNFEHRRGDTTYLRNLGDLSEGEFALLLWDLSCWKGLVRSAALLQRPCGVPALEEYLRPGREHWGEIGALLRAWAGTDEEFDGLTGG